MIYHVIVINNSLTSKFCFYTVCLCSMQMILWLYRLYCIQNNKQQTHIIALIQANLGELAPEMHSLYSAHSINVTIIVTPIPSNHFPPSRRSMWHCTTPQPLSMFSWAYLFVWLPQPPK